MSTETSTTSQPTRRHNHREHRQDPFIHLRQWLNIIFMVGAVIGMVVYFFSNHTLGTYIILGAMIFKIVECVIRFIR